MNDRPARVVDAHVHIWDPANTEWYPYLGHPPRNGAGDPTRMYRRFDVATYRAECAEWNVEKFVNVAAATGAGSVEETLALDRSAAHEGGPHAIIGGLPPTASVADAIALLDRQMDAPRFRGVRQMGGLGLPLPEPDVLGALAARGLVFELMTHADGLEPAAAHLAGADELTVVVEHTGWPRSDTAEERAMWRRGIDALAGLGPHVVCKLSGLAMAFGSMDPVVLAPWIEGALEAFGVDRCLFASNFPVDAQCGSYDDLYSAFATLTAGLDPVSRDKLFAANAERVYRL
jgi:L-fuconolactonase